MSGFETGFTPNPASAQRARLAATLRADLDRLGHEAVTGRAADAPRALGGLTREAQTLSARREALDAYAEAGAIAAGRAGASQVALGAIDRAVHGVLDDAPTVLTTATDQALGVLGAEADGALRGAVSALGTRYGATALFAGDATDRGALVGADTILADARAAALAAGGGAAGQAALRTVFDAPGGAFATGHYTGGAGPAPGVAIDEGAVVETGLRADDAVFRDVLRELAALAVATDTSVTPDREERHALAGEATGRLRGALDALGDTRARLGLVEAGIEETRVAREAEATALDLALEKLTARDPFEAATALVATEDALESLFAATGRLSALSLTAYLR